jgi:pterin-4a-carbinolamine dehydratase
MESLLEHMTALTKSVHDEDILYENSLEKVMDIPLNRSSEDLPVTVKSFKWKQVNIGGINKLQRQYEFQDTKSLVEFLNKLLLYQHATIHHGLQVIHDLNVMITVYTHDINDVTKRDLNYAKVSDQIYNQVLHVER